MLFAGLVGNLIAMHACTECGEPYCLLLGLALKVVEHVACTDPEYGRFVQV